MSAGRKRPGRPARAQATAPRARSTHNRQRQRLIDACISALHIYGPSRTTVEKVVAIAKMSPGIVRFYFDSKAAMLVASLQFLSAEFEEQVLEPVSRLKANPVAALERLVDLYLDPEIASPRKVSVWYAFWGEASSRQEYYDICGQKDESFAALVHELIERLIAETGQRQLDPGGIALGLIGALEMLWQDFAFRDEHDIDREGAKRRCMTYLRSIFPGRFCAAPERAPPAAGAERLAGWAYGGARSLALEREALFQGAWQPAAHLTELPRAGDFVTADLGTERVVLVRDGFGAVHALRNSCPRAPHALAAARSGRFPGEIECAIHGLRFGLDGRCAPDGTALVALELEILDGILWVRAPGAGSQPPLRLLDEAAARAVALAPPPDIRVRADWKLIIEQWLESMERLAPPQLADEWIDWAIEPPRLAPGWSGARYRRLAGACAAQPWLERFIAPNLWLERRGDGVRLLQVVASGPGEARIRRIELAAAPGFGASGALQYLAGRMIPLARRSSLAIAQSAQEGVSGFGYRADGAAAASVGWFRRHLTARVPALALERPPNDLP